MGGALQIDIWVADKKVRQAEPAPEELTEAFETMMAPDDAEATPSSSQNDIDAMFYAAGGGGRA